MDAGLNKDLLCETTGWHNNCGLNCLTHFLYSKLETGELQKAFLNHPEYEALLTTFQEYYQLKTKPTWDQIKTLLQNLEAPHDREAILAPVLRKRLSQTLLDDKQKIWDTTATAAFSQYLTTGKVEDVARPVFYSNQAYFEALKAEYDNKINNDSNQDQEALLNTYLKTAEAYWLNINKGGCELYADYIGDLKKGEMISADSLKLYCSKLSIGAEVYTDDSFRPYKVLDISQLTKEKIDSKAENSVRPMSELPEGNAANAIAGVVYLSNDGDYILRKATGGIISGLISINKVDPKKIETILSAISARGNANTGTVYEDKQNYHVFNHKSGWLTGQIPVGKTALEAASENRHTPPVLQDPPSESLTWHMPLFNTGAHWQIEEPHLHQSIEERQALSQIHNAYYGDHVYAQKSLFETNIEGINLVEQISPYVQKNIFQKMEISPNLHNASQAAMGDLLDHLQSKLTKKIITEEQQKEIFEFYFNAFEDRLKLSAQAKPPQKLEIINDLIKETKEIKKIKKEDVSAYLEHIKEKPKPKP